jgi:hypothetical protein
MPAKLALAALIARALIESDTARWGDIVKSIGISVP